MAPSIGLMPPGTGNRVVETAVRAEDLGYESVWISEGWGRNAFVTLSEIACRTDEVRLGTSIVNVYSRTPAVLAMAAASLARVSDDRFVLGLGASHPQIVEGLHDLPYDRPVRRTHEVVELVRALTAADGDVAYEGELFSVSGYPSLDRPVPIYNAALGPSNRRATGRLCDGWLPFNVPFPDLGDAFETIADAARAAGRDADDVEVVPWVAAAVSDDGDEARFAIRQNVASYVGNFAAYRNAVGEHYDEVDRIAARWEAGDRDAAARAVTDEMVAALGVAGTPEEARAGLREIVDEPVVDVPVISVPRTVDEDAARRTVEELSPSNL